MDEKMTKKYKFFKDNIETNYCNLNYSADGKKVYFCLFYEKNCDKCEAKKDCYKIFGNVIPEIRVEYIKKMQNEIPELFI